PGGRLQGAVQLTLSADTIERMRTGYMCAKCLEPLQHAWPERCPLCGAPIRTEQAEFFAKEFGGEVRLGPSTDWDYEAALSPRRTSPPNSLAKNSACSV